jgi:hypothetical protein
MDKISLIKSAIEKADKFQSKLTPEAMEVPFLGSLKIRALLNNLGELATNFLEIGSHKSGSCCSTIFQNHNIKKITVIDSWESDETNEDKAYPQFMANTLKFKPATAELSVIVSDCFSVELDGIRDKFDLYGYDAGHSRQQQRDALIYYKPVLAETFIYCCDDWAYQEVKEGTIEGIKEGGYEVLFERELLNPDGFPEDAHLNDHWWRGYYLALLKKKT